MKLLAAGRASRVYDLGDGRVLRRLLGPGRLEREAAVMAHAREHGVPVPRVLDVRDREIVLERVGGPTMLADLQRRPWRLRAHAWTLADLHERVHAVRAPSGLEALGDGDALLHLDLHPDNVLLSPAGAVLIDWTNARRGDPANDVALSWLLGMTSAPLVFRPFVRAFAAHVGRDVVAEGLSTAAGYRLRDPNVTEAERRRIERLLERVSAG